MSADLYFRWLLELIGNSDDLFMIQNYQKLLWKLFATDYFYELKLDKNRAADGLYLRRSFGREYGDESFCLTGPDGSERPCSVLEMLIAIAKDTEDHLMFNPDFGDRTSLWFWIFIRNLGLDLYDDYHWYEDIVDQILDTFMHHRYAPDGSGGGMFVVRNSRFDMRETDLWLQLNMWFQENFPVENW